MLKLADHGNRSNCTRSHTKNIHSTGRLYVDSIISEATMQVSESHETEGDSGSEEDSNCESGDDVWYDSDARSTGSEQICPMKQMMTQR